jgi:hypothetical protein
MYDITRGFQETDAGAANIATYTELPGVDIGFEGMDKSPDGDTDGGSYADVDYFDEIGVDDTTVKNEGVDELVDSDTPDLGEPDSVPSEQTTDGLGEVALGVDIDLTVSEGALPDDHDEVPIETEASRPPVWEEESFFYRDRARSAACWVPPEPAESAAQDTEPSDVDSPPQQHISAYVDGELRVLSGPAVAMAQEFQRTAAERTERGHDCVMFAAACQSGESYQDVNKGPGGVTTFVGYDKLARGAADKVDQQTKAGDAVMIAARAKPTDMGAHRAHVLVKATADSGPGLYLSKGGPGGKVLLTSLAAMMHVYDVPFVGTVNQILVHPYEQDYPPKR